ncbi:glycosyltransferase family 39 protein [Candidatus Gottesmanbacteria bacterium]|nr:glycosyltransferase family 39 protein [Candidatus Gottesmanbacteria bacterium]
MKIKKFVLVALLFIIAFTLRVYKLGIIPPSPDWDEAAIGYNAYSLLKTGKDEYGSFLPIVFRSFDDYKPPLTIYLTVPSIAVFGLNTFAVRFPSAILGTLTVLVTYFLVSKLFRRQSVIPFLTAFLLAISPWHLQFSRVAFETNIALFFNVTGVWLFLEGLRRPRLWILSAISFALAPYTYHSARVFTPLLILGLVFFFRKDMLGKKKWAIAFALLLLVIMIPLGLILLSPEGRLRLKGVSALADQTGILRRDIIKIEDDQKAGLPLANLLHNRRLTYALVVVDGYLRHFDLKWLFLDGDIPRHHAPGLGILYLWELPFLFLGIYQIAFKEKEARKIVFWWFLVAPIAAAPTTELPHSVRTLTFLPTFQIFTAYGMISIIRLIRQIGWVWRLAVFPYLFFILFNIFYYFHQYYIHLPIESSQYWQFGYKEAVEEVKKVYDKYDNIIVSTKLEEPYMFFLFYLKYDPKKYLDGGGTASGGFAEYRDKFAKFEFRPIDLKKEKLDSRTLLIGTPDELPGSAMKTIYYLDDTEAIKLVSG